MAPDQSHSDRTAVGVVRLLRGGCLIAGGRVVDFPSGGTVYTEADAERLAVMMHGLLRVYMHAGDGRQVTVRYVRAGDLLGARLYDVLEELAGNTFASVRQRVARHLLDLATSRQGASHSLTASVNQQDLANSVGSVREVVARVLAELRSEHLVRTSPGRVEILDPVRMSHELWSRARDESHSP